MKKLSGNAFVLDIIKRGFNMLFKVIRVTSRKTKTIRSREKGVWCGAIRD